MVPAKPSDIPEPVRERPVPPNVPTVPAPPSPQPPRRPGATLATNGAAQPGPQPRSVGAAARGFTQQPPEPHAGDALRVPSPAAHAQRIALGPNPTANDILARAKAGGAATLQEQAAKPNPAITDMLKNTPHERPAARVQDAARPQILPARTAAAPTVLDRFPAQPFTSSVTGDLSNFSQAVTRAAGQQSAGIRGRFQQSAINLLTPGDVADLHSHRGAEGGSCLTCTPSRPARSCRPTSRMCSMAAARSLEATKRRRSTSSWTTRAAHTGR